MKKLSNKELYNQFYNDYRGGLPAKDLKEKYGCNYYTFMNILNKNEKGTNLKFERLNIPIDELVEKYINGVSTAELAKYYNCSVTAIIKRIKIYEEIENKKVLSHEAGRKKLNLPAKEIFEKNINGISTNKLAIEYNCSKSAISNTIKRYAKSSNYIMPTAKNKKIELPMEEIYKEYISGVAKNEISIKYNCSASTIGRKLDKYIKKNNLPVDFDKVQLYKNIYEDYNSGLDITTLANKYKTKKSTISKKLRQYASITGSPLSIKRGTFDDEELEILYNEYKNGISITDLAGKYGCTNKTIYLNLNKYCNRINKSLSDIDNDKRVKKVPSTLIYESHRNGRSKNSLAREYGVGAYIIDNRLKKEYKLAFLRELKQMLIVQEQEQEQKKLIK